VFGEHFGHFRLQLVSQKHRFVHIVIDFTLGYNRQQAQGRQGKFLLALDVREDNVSQRLASSASTSAGLRPRAASSTST
jgi:hypothetical protein